MGVREEVQIRCPGHLKWVRGHECAACQSGRDFCIPKRIEAAHVRIGTDGGTALKPGDNWSIPLCDVHHSIQHRIGERSFELDYQINMKRIAFELWTKSPHGIKWRKDHA